MIEKALGIATQELEQNNTVKLNNHERRLLRYYQQSSVEGKQAIMNVAETMATLASEKEKPKPSEAYKVA